MQSIRHCVKHLALYGRSVTNKTNILSSVTNLAPAWDFHVSVRHRTNLTKYEAPKGFLKYNESVFPPQKPGEEKRPAVSCIMQIYYILNY